MPGNRSLSSPMKITMSCSAASLHTKRMQSVRMLAYRSFWHQLPQCKTHS